ncbi:MAG: hypothetical protein LQ340_001571 [Diploschistes diacapsis]|nr:MAG: hypothetical protein LQ340_001571 [Diploschistes diacapsis]
MATTKPIVIPAQATLGVAVAPAVTPVAPDWPDKTDSAEESAEEAEARAEEALADSLTRAVEADPAAEDAALCADETALPASEDAEAMILAADVTALPAAEEAEATTLPAAEEILATTLDVGMMIPVAVSLATLDTETSADETVADAAETGAEVTLAALDDAEFATPLADDATTLPGTV